MKVSEIMTRDVETVSPGDTIRTAAKMMDELNVGVLPVCDRQRLVGVITDRDITVRATSAGKAPDGCKVAEVMTAEVDWCLEDDAVDEAAEKMQTRQIRRLPVVDRNRRLVGVLSLGDIATDAGRGAASETLKDVSQPSRPDRR